MKTLPNLMENPRFKALIDGFSEVIQTCSAESLDAGRKRCTQFFLSQSCEHTPIASIQNVNITGRDQNQIALRIYNPAPQQKLPVAVYAHRGGWVFGNIEEADPVCRMLAHYLQCVLASVDYRLAPENPFPSPLHDCYDAARWAYQNLTEKGTRKFFVCGESAGGNLMGAVAQMAKERKEFPLAAQLLIYPMINPTIHEPSYDDCPDRHFITKEAISFMWGAYLQSPERASLPYAALDRTPDLSDLPPTVIITGEYDPLCAEAEQYGEKLRQAGVAVRLKRFPELIHGFLDLPLYEAEQKIDWIKEIRSLLPLR